MPVVPELSETIPDYIMVAISRGRTGATAVEGLRRWRVTFVSSSPRDLDTEFERLRQGRGYTPENNP